MDFNFKRDYERFRKSDEFVEMMKFDDLASVNCFIANLGMDLYCKTEEWAESHPYIPEIDWNKVRTGTKVEVKYSYGREWMPRILLDYKENTLNKFWVFDTPAGLSATGFPYCRLVEDNPEYYKD